MNVLSGLIIVVGLGIFVWIIVGFFIFIGRVFTSTPINQTRPPAGASDDIDGMNNGDYYNGPHGYSAMTGYPETQYGSDFDPDAEWNHEEHY